MRPVSSLAGSCAILCVIQNAWHRRIVLFTTIPSARRAELCLQSIKFSAAAAAADYDLETIGGPPRDR